MPHWDFSQGFSLVVADSQAMDGLADAQFT